MTWLPLINAYFGEALNVESESESALLHAEI